MTVEEELLISILFRKKCYKLQDFEHINFDSLVKIASSHLMLPALYINLKIKNYLNNIPAELKNYLKEIYELNRERNLILKSEVNEISKILKENKIKHVFLKGSAHIFTDMYADIGERMVGDIDVLIDENDFIKSIKTVKKAGYKDIEYSFFDYKHYKRQIHKNKIFAIELHKTLLEKEYTNLLNPKQIIREAICIDNINIPSYKSQYLYNIYNYQINDYGNLILSYSYRSIYDAFKLVNEKSYDIVRDKYINNYLMITKILKVSKLRDLKYEENKLNFLWFHLIQSNRIIYLINYIFFKQLKILPKQILELLINKKYREYTLKKNSSKH